MFFDSFPIVKRLHDIGRSVLYHFFLPELLLLAVILLVGVGHFLSVTHKIELKYIIVFYDFLKLLATGYWLLFLYTRLLMLFKKGIVGSNKYDPNPLQKNQGLLSFLINSFSGSNDFLHLKVILNLTIFIKR